MTPSNGESPTVSQRTPLGDIHRGWPERPSARRSDHAVDAEGSSTRIPRGGDSPAMGANQNAVEAMNERSVWQMREIAS